MRFAILLTAAGLVASACTATSNEAPSLSPHGSIVRLAVDGAVNGNASIASSGKRVGVVWSATRDAGANIYAAISEDGGVTFGVPIRVNDIDNDARVTGEQPPRIAIAKDIVVVWESRSDGKPRVRFTRSTDGGRTFPPAVNVEENDLTGTRGWASVTLDNNGGAHVVWLDGRNAHADHQAGASANGSGHAMHGTSRQDIFHAVFKPNGEQTELPVAENVCFCCKTSVATAEDGATYVAWRHIYPTNLRDIAVARSEDGIQSFSKPVRVSEDHWQIDGCPEDGPAIAVDRQLRLHIVWPSLLEGSDSQKAIFYSAALDLGKSFAPRVRLDEEAAGSAGASHPQLTHLASGAVAVWEAGSGAGRRIQSRAMTPASVRPGPILTLADSLPGSYPSIAPIPGGVIVAWTAKGTEASGPSEIHVQRLNH